MVQACQGAGVVFALARLESVAAQKSLARLGLIEVIGRDHVFESVAAALDSLKPSAAR